MSVTPSKCPVKVSHKLCELYPLNMKSTASLKVGHSKHRPHVACDIGCVETSLYPPWVISSFQSVKKIINHI